MHDARRLNAKASAWLASLLMVILVAGCGGGGGGSGDNAVAPASVTDNSTNVPAGTITEAGAPLATGDMATDGFNWFNFRRQQMGLAALARNTQIDKAASNHSNYQALNDTITHDEVAGKRGFTGVSVLNRLQAAQYQFPASNYAYGEVISATADTNGVSAAEDLIAAIYHRFVIFEPKFLETGAASATAGSGYTYFTTNFATRTLDQGGLGDGRLVTYPFKDQQNLPVVFFSDQEQPDPVPDRNEVGYPVSVHADITSVLTVQSFTINPHGGAALTTKLLRYGTDPEINRPSVASIIPLAVLQAQTLYDVRFVGSVDGVPVTLAWSFKTR
jgi:uncharacterized protein YkwD